MKLSFYNHLLSNYDASTAQDYPEGLRGIRTLKSITTT